MHDGGPALRDPKDQIVVLGSVILRPESPNLPRSLGTDCGQVRDVHVPAEALGSPVRFAEGLGRDPILIHGIPVGVEDFGGRRSPAGRNHFGQCGRLEGVVVVQEGDKWGRHQLEPCVRGPADPPILRQHHDRHTRIPCGSFEDRPDFGVLAGVVNEDQLPVIQRLLADRGDGQPQVPGRGRGTRA